MELAADRNDIRQCHYLAGAMILYSAAPRMADHLFVCEQGAPTIELNMYPNNLDKIPVTNNFCGRRQKLDELNSILRRMATRASQSIDVCTITGIGGQGKTTLVMEAARRAAHFFPGGIFTWKFVDGVPISATKYLSSLVDVIFSDQVNAICPKDIPTELNHEDVLNLGRTIFKHFKTSALLILDHADTLKLAEANDEEGAVVLVDLIKEVASRRDIAVKILVTSQRPLEWTGEKSVHLEGFSDLDIESGWKLFLANLTDKAREKMTKAVEGNTKENTEQLLCDLVVRMDGHPLSLILLGRAASQPQHSDKLLENIVHKHYGTMLADEDFKKKVFKGHFGPMIDSLTTQQRLVLYVCSFFDWPNYSKCGLVC